MLENLDIAQLIHDYAIPWGIKIVFALIIFTVGRHRGDRQYQYIHHHHDNHR